MSDLVEVVEAAYRLDLEEGPWLAGLLDVAAEHVDAGLGVAGLSFDASDPGKIENRAILARGRILEDVQIIAAIGADAGADVMKTLMWRAGCATASQILGRGAFVANPAFRGHGFTRGYFDWMQINALDPTRVGCMIGAPMPSTAPVPAARRQTWNRIAAHLAAAVRLRNACRGVVLDPTGAEAVLEPDGRAVHADGEATQKDALRALREAAVAVDRARGSMRRRQPEDAVAIWRALVSGRWSLVDHFDSDGRRFLVARRNDDTVRDPRALSDRERQGVGLAALGHSNKLIAYTLGISVSRVGTILGEARRKLGARTRVEMIATVRALAGHADVEANR